MSAQILFENSDHRNILLEDFTSGRMVQTNQHLIIDGGRAILLDPGGAHLFPQVLEELSSVIPVEALDAIFLSHQDPDVVGAAPHWLMATQAEAYISQLWVRFLMHFGVDDQVADRVVPLPDQGGTIPLGGCRLVVLPAHFLHGAGNFQVYDPVAKILYSGDLGASLGQTYAVAPNFDDHLQYMEGFHRRYLPSNVALKLWAQMVAPLEIEVIAPQHGAMIAGSENVRRFIAWVSELRCGLDLMGGMYRIPAQL